MVGNGLMRRYGTLTLTLLVLGLSTTASLYIVRAALPYLAVDVGASPKWVARVLYVGFIVLTILNPLTGYLCDRFGRLRMALLSTSLVSLITAYFAIIHSVHELLITRVAQAVATQFLIASSLGLAAEVTSVGGVGCYQDVDALGDF